MLKIKHKIFLIIVLANLLLIGGLFWMASQSFEQSFRDYIDDTQAKELQPLTESIAKKVESEGWQWLSGAESRQWRRMLDNYYFSRQLQQNQLPEPPQERMRGQGPNRLPPMRLFLLDENKRLLLGPPELANQLHREGLSDGDIRWLTIVNSQN